jgi:uncharacterized protein (DUF305 family)
MKSRFLLIAVLGATLPAASALAQDQTASEIKLPEACQQAGQMPANMGDMHGMMQQMHQNMGGQMSEAAKAYMQAMMEMHPPMMQGAMAQDPDVAFNCSMIAHHQGAIAMARIELQYGKDDEAKKMAQKTIDEQSKEVAEMTKWVEEHAKK